MADLRPMRYFPNELPPRPGDANTLPYIHVHSVLPSRPGEVNVYFHTVLTPRKPKGMFKRFLASLRLKKGKGGGKKKRVNPRTAEEAARRESFYR